MITKLNKALFLDRDGVINIEKEYLYKIEDFEFIDGIFELCKYYQNLGYLIFVITNQSGIARKYYNEDDFNVLTQWMLGEFEKKDIIISKVYYCPHFPEISGVCDCRKPKPGMFLQAKDEFNLDMPNSIMVGDKERDIEAAHNAGVVETYLYDDKKSVKFSLATKIVNKLEDIWINRC
jgi:D-glycero-D-manno-heptose 1,7-bisphosphate phosphatase